MTQFRDLPSAKSRPAEADRAAKATGPFEFARSSSNRSAGMRREIPSVRVLPMSDKLQGFRGRSIEQVQAHVFLRALPRMNGRYRYRAAGLNAEPGTVVLFQFKARIIASAVFLRDEKLEKPDGGYGGALYFDAESFRTFEPVDAQGMRKVWPDFRGFGHVKQALNPMRYSMFKRHLKNVAIPASSTRSSATPFH